MRDTSPKEQREKIRKKEIFAAAANRFPEQITYQDIVQGNREKDLGKGQKY